MKKIPRLHYLSNFKGSVDQNYNLICGGLHDSNSIIIELEEYLKASNDKFIFKPHPRASLNNETKNIIKSLVNLEFSNKNLMEILKKCNNVFCTYSSIGYESILLDIDVKIIDLPGALNLSQLADYDFIKCKNLSHKVEFISRKI